MKKKALLILSILCLCFITYSFTFATSTNPGSDAILPKVILSSSNIIVNADDEITLKVKISDLGGGSIKDIELTYNAIQLLYISGGNLELDGKLKYSEEIKEDDTVIEFKFKVKEDATGSIKFGVSAKYYDEQGELSKTTPTYIDDTRISMYKKSDNNTISYVSVNNKSIFANNGTYSVLLANTVKKATVFIQASEKTKIAIKKDGKVLIEENEKIEKELELSNINNSFDIEVTAENGEVKNYTLKINREPVSTTGSIINDVVENTTNNNTINNEVTIPTTATPSEPEETIDEKSTLLKSLSVSNGELTPEFNPYILTYGMKVGLEVDAIEVTAKAEDEGAQVKVTGNENLKEGINTIKIEVVNGDISRTYVITVNKTDRKDESNATLQFLNIENVEITPNFSPDIYEYSCIIPLETTSLNISTMAAEEGTVLVILGNENLQVGENIITIEVTSENGEVSHNYVIKAIKVDQIYEVAINETETVEMSKVNKRSTFLIISIIVALALCVLYMMLKYKYEKDKVRNKIIENIEKKKVAEEKENKE